MSGKPSYDELVSRILHLEKAEKALIDSERKWRNILVNTPQIGVSLDPQARIVFANVHFLELTGWQEKEIIGKDWFNTFIPENIRYEVRNIFQTVMSQRDTLGYSTNQNQIITRSGDLRDVAWSNVLTKDAQGNIVDVTCLGIDLTERIKLEASLRKSQRFLTTIFNSIQDGICVLDADLNIVRVNQAMKDLYPHALPLEGKKCYAAYHGRTDPCKICPTIRALKSGKLEMSEIPLENPGMDVGVLELFAFPIIGDSGNSIGVVEYVRNITDKKAAEVALLESEERFRTLVEKSPMGISLITADGYYKYINPQFSIIFGYSIEDIPTGKEWFKKAYPNKEYRKKVIKAWFEDLKEKSDEIAWPRIFIVACKDGTRKKIQFLSVVMENQDRLVIYEDITEKSSLEQQLLQAQKYEAIGTLAGGVAHDFNNLLMGIQGRTSLISLEMEPTHHCMEHVKAIEGCIRSATSLTKQLLGFARKGKYEVKPININQLVVDSSTMFSRARKELDIHTKIAESALVVDADPVQIEQVLLNLFVNAWQAMPDGGQIFIETSAVKLDEIFCNPYSVKPGQYARVSVTDTGIGMNEETCRQIFDPFFTTKEKSRGTGLGLASAYGIINNHGGIINVNSEINQGTTFNIYLPISGKKIDVQRSTEVALLKGTETILLVDDEDIIVDVGEKMLKAMGYRVLMSKSGFEAIEKMQNHGDQIDLVILDLIMPGMDGGKTFYRIREMYPKVPILLSSGYAVNGLATEILQSGCNGFIQKPFNIAELSQKIRSIFDTIRIKR